MEALRIKECNSCLPQKFFIRCFMETQTLTKLHYTVGDPKEIQQLGQEAPMQPSQAIEGINPIVGAFLLGAVGFILGFGFSLATKILAPTIKEIEIPR